LGKWLGLGTPWGVWGGFGFNMDMYLFDTPGPPGKFNIKHPGHPAKFAGLSAMEIAIPAFAIRLKSKEAEIKFSLQNSEQTISAATAQIGSCKATPSPPRKEQPRDSPTPTKGPRRQEGPTNQNHD
jgi:hypothetical protein